MHRIGIYGVVILLALMLNSGTALAANGRQFIQGQPLQAGPYLVQVTFSQNPPYVGQAFTITVVSQNDLALTGRVIAEPENGTDAIPAHASLNALAGHPGTLVGILSLSVRGNWRLTFEFNGPLGPASASLPITARVPFDMPAWLGWLIGLIPLAIFLWWLWRQGRYRRNLLDRASRKKPGSIEQSTYSAQSRGK
ncbi:MAG TPA: hypothetical protein VFA09_08560 [Ktedonobacteraceae bacterium]|jgi:hypothetical protein|nr:hypothetical protein [Ktedonobacteraceae bacterium]